MDLLTKPLRGRGTSPVLFRARSSLSEGSHQPLLTLNPLVVEETSDFSCLAQCGERRLLLRADSHRVRASRGKATRWREVDWRWWLPLWQCPLLFLIFGSGARSDARSVCEYGCFGAEKNSSVFASSTIFPEYITATLVQTLLTTARPDDAREDRVGSQNAYYPIRAIGI